MNENNNKWLDEIISRTINTNKPQFDAEKWKHRFPDELQQLRSRATYKLERSHKRLILRGSPAVKFAAAAVVIMAIGFLVICINPGKNADNFDTTKLSQPANEMLTMESLTIAFNKGGTEEIEKQFKKALRFVGPQPKNISMSELFEGNKS